MDRCLPSIGLERMREDLGSIGPYLKGHEAIQKIKTSAANVYDRIKRIPILDVALGADLALMMTGIAYCVYRGAHVNPEYIPRYMWYATTILAAGAGLAFPIATLVSKYFPDEEQSNLEMKENTK